MSRESFIINGDDKETAGSIQHAAISVGECNISLYEGDSLQVRSGKVRASDFVCNIGLCEGDVLQVRSGIA